MALDWTFDLHPMFSVFGVSVRYYTVLFFVALIAGWGALRWQMVRAGADEYDADRVLVLSVLGIWLGGRLGHLAFYEPHVLLEAPWAIFALKQAGLASHGAFLGLVGVLAIFAKWRGHHLVDLFDQSVFSMGIASVLIRIGNFMNSEVVGLPTGGAWGVRFPRHDVGVVPAPLRHPTQLYEAAWGVLLLAFMVYLDRRRPHARGTMISACISFYFVGRIVLEFTKDSAVVALGLNTGQWLSVGFLLAGLLGVWRTRARAASGL